MSEDGNSTVGQKAVAFLVTDRHNAKAARADRHLRRLATRFGLHYVRETIGEHVLALVLPEPVEIKAAGCVTVTVGADRPGDPQQDRYLTVQLRTGGEIEVENDYAGSVPLFYSRRGGWSLSNVEPCVVLSSGAGLSDVSFENLYGYLRFSHFIWDETLYGHISQMRPDSRYTFGPDGLGQSTKASLRSSDSRIGLDDKRVAAELFELNEELVQHAFAPYAEVVLPLSSGYDSRMILAVAETNPSLARKLNCFTYGADGSLEVEAARKLTSQIGCRWRRVALPCTFLEGAYPGDVFDIFGSSLHMHGMYQIEFFNEIAGEIGGRPDTCLMSGFMTGVPAGQHNSLLGIRSESDSLAGCMGTFPQSQIWTARQLSQLEVFDAKRGDELTEARFASAFAQLDGPVHQRAVTFDVWTRQRNFISYYPRTMEWLTSTVSPHMNTAYANFFLSLSEPHLRDRNAVELMFARHYPRTARVISNSNGLKAISGRGITWSYKLARYVKALHMEWLLPGTHKLTRDDFDTRAARSAGEKGFFPLFEASAPVEELVRWVGGRTMLRKCYDAAIAGDHFAFMRLSGLQSVAWSLHHAAEE